jgi:hypothetical protein
MATPIATGESTFTGQVGYFFASILTEPAGALPKGAQWIITFDGFPSVISKVADFDPNFAGKWNIENAYNSLATNDTFFKIKGCMFAYAVRLPGEAFQISNEGIQYGGLLRPSISRGRSDRENLTIDFFDNNVSFVENVVRPWVIVTSYLGMVAYPKGSTYDYRTNATFYKLGVVSRDLPPYIRQTFSFYGVCPISVGNEEYNYQPVTSPHIRQSEFVYNYYTVDSSGDILT